MSKLIRVFFEGMGSLAIITPDEPRGARRLNPNNYIHKSASDAISSDWHTVGSHLFDAAKRSADSGEEKTAAEN